MRLLLTGANGMVGRNLLEHPLIKDFEVLAPSRKDLDLSNAATVEKYLTENHPDIVIHAAGKVGGVQANLREPVSFLVENLDIGRNVILGAYKAGIKKLINLGSSCMYPRNHEGLLTEEMILQGELEPTNEGYALAKIVAARLCEYIKKEDESFQYKTVIPCNIYGPYDKFDPAHSHLIPAIIYKIYHAKKTKQPSVEIWGDGNAKREFMYSGDLADALMQAILKYDQLSPVTNIGLGQDYTVNEYYKIVAKALEYEGDFSHDLTKPVGMRRKVVDIEKQLKWGWQAQHNLQEGIEKTINYFVKEQY